MENMNDDQQRKSDDLSASSPEPEAKIDEYQAHPTKWHGINLEIRHCPSWLSSQSEMVTQHIEIRSEDRVALPITGSGFLSHFMNGADAMAEFDNDPVKFVHCWLDEAANSKEWRKQVEAARQLSLF